ncbi:MAG: VOC family protein [Eubacteriales bacterium]|jgi:catechol 2,3-dioxygenase-like lactoylglutathione lyase family enzyme|nr:VOC family protein [Clostridiales bacterium]MDY5731775.1 VOC family protein [Eubacteriales bacterium]
MKYTSTLIAVKDMDISKQFYHNVLGLNVVANFGANVTLDGGIVLQTLDTWKSFIRMYNVTLPNNAGELYFEEDDMDAFCNHLKSFDICYVHELYEHRWGQRVIRFYDPDKHIIEVGEKLDAVVLRFIEQGLSPEQTAVSMDIPLDFVLSCLNK